MIGLPALLWWYFVPGGGLARTPLGHRHAVKYPALGISIDLPRKALTIRNSYYDQLSINRPSDARFDDKGRLWIAMYPFWPGMFLAEPEYMLDFEFVRLSPEQANLFELGQSPLKDLPEFYGVTNSITTNEISGFELRTVVRSTEKETDRCFIRKVMLPDGDTVLAAATIRFREENLPISSNELADIEAILNSVQALESK